MKRTFALMAMMAGLAGSVTLVTAQDAKTKPKADDKKAAPTAKATGSIEIYEGKKGWRFNIKNGEDKTIAMATKGYEKKEEVLKEIENIKAILISEKPKEVAAPKN
jgi:uncharacterized protein YegP (UPF0339 family)